MRSFALACLAVSFQAACYPMNCVLSNNSTGTEPTLSNPLKGTPGPVGTTAQSNYDNLQIRPFAPSLTWENGLTANITVPQLTSTLTGRPWVELTTNSASVKGPGPDCWQSAAYAWDGSNHGITTSGSPDDLGCLFTNDSWNWRQTVTLSKTKAGFSFPSTVWDRADSKIVFNSEGYPVSASGSSTDLNCCTATATGSLPRQYTTTITNGVEEMVKTTQHVLKYTLTCTRDPINFVVNINPSELSLITSPGQTQTQTLSVSPTADGASVGTWSMQALLDTNMNEDVATIKIADMAGTNIPFGEMRSYNGNVQLQVSATGLRTGTGEQRITLNVELP